MSLEEKCKSILILCMAHLPVKRDIETKFPVSYFGRMHVQNKKYGHFVSISRLGERRVIWDTCNMGQH